MGTINKPSPSKQQVRDYMQQRRTEHTPPPDPAEIRRQLGWSLKQAEDMVRSR